MLLARDSDWKTAWQLAEMYERIEVKEKLKDLVKQIQQNRTEVRNELLLDKMMGGRPVWFPAAKRGTVKLLMKLSVRE
jgi:hypothetical protein